MAHVHALAPSTVTRSVPCLELTAFANSMSSTTFAAAIESNGADEGSIRIPVAPIVKTVRAATDAETTSKRTVFIRTSPFNPVDWQLRFDARCEISRSNPRPPKRHGVKSDHD